MLGGGESNEHQTSSGSRSHKSSANVERLAAALPNRYVFHRELGKGGAAYGIARAVAVKRDETITVSGVTLGTAEYMSPEQCGAVRELDRRCDVYALGCVVYEMLVGQPPFTGATEQAIIARHCNEPPQ